MSCGCNKNENSAQAASPESGTGRRPCMDCVRKHLAIAAVAFANDPESTAPEHVAQANVLLTEARTGAYPVHALYAIGHLGLVQQFAGCNAAREGIKAVESGDLSNKQVAVEAVPVPATVADVLAHLGEAESECRDPAFRARIHAVRALVRSGKWTADFDQLLQASMELQ